MAVKFIIFATVLAMAHAGNIISTHYAATPIASVAPLAYATPAVTKIAASIIAKHIEEPYDANPQYSYSYDIQDSLTGDNKQQYESRNGDVVQGSYSFIEADGSRRIVEYIADPLNGFNAVVRKEPAVAAVSAPVIAKAPIAYNTPVAASIYAKAPLIYAHPAQAVTLPVAQPVAKLATTIYH